MMTAREARMNLLRAVAATFAAGLGGADSITVLPPSLVLGFPDGFARRMARNVQLVLLEEAHLHRVGDPASGAGYVEALTQSLAAEAWSIFQGIERRGGMAAALHSGHVQNMVREAAGKRNERVASRRKPIVGVSEFLDPSYVAPAVLDVARHELARAPDVSAIPAQRLSEPFEALHSRQPAAAAGRPMSRFPDFTRIALATLPERQGARGVLIASGMDDAGRESRSTSLSPRTT